MGVIVALKRSSTMSAMIGLSVWLLFALITPSLINLFVLSKEPLPNRSELIHAMRNQNDLNWENPKTYVLSQFYTSYPEFNDGDTINFDKWYYASFTLLDDKADLMTSAFEEQVRKRNNLLSKWEWLAPAAMVHEKLAHISQTDRDQHLSFLEDLNAYHEELKNLYYTRIFEEKQFSLEDLESLKNKL